MTRQRVATAALWVALVAVAVWTFWSGARPQYHLTRANVTLPQGTSLATDSTQFAVSPDGQLLAINLRSAEGVRVWSWRFDTVDARPLAGTEGVTSWPVWSPDSQNIAFVSEGKLRRVPIGGGLRQTIGEFDPAAALDWGSDETFLYANGPGGAIRQIAASPGGRARQVTRLDPDEAHNWPAFLPDGEHFLFFKQADQDRTGVWIASLDGSQSATRVLPRAVTAVVAGQYVVYSQDRSVVAQRFDASTASLSGNPITLVDGVRMAETSHRLAFSTSTSLMHAVLAYQQDSDGTLHLIRDWPALLDK